jgi:1,4-dihydroxy-2-naphthoyl-CoA hydrolase
MPFTYNRTVHFQDTDAAGVVYFANVLTICHEAYEASLGATGINLRDFFSSPSVAFPIVHANVDYFRPMFCGDKLIVSLMPQKLSVDKFEINYEIFIKDLVVTKAITRHVCIDKNSRVKRELPNEMISWLETTAPDAEKNERRKSREIM